MPWLDEPAIESVSPSAGHDIADAPPEAGAPGGRWLDEAPAPPTGGRWLDEAPPGHKDLFAPLPELEPREVAIPERGLTMEQLVTPQTTPKRVLDTAVTALTTPALHMPKVGSAQTVADADDVMAANDLRTIMRREGIPEDRIPSMDELLGGYSRKPTTGEQVLAGGANVAASLPEFFTSPLGIATLGTGALPSGIGRGVSAAFALDMARHLPEQKRRLQEAIAENDPQKITEAAGDLAATTLFLGQTAHHAALGGRRAKGAQGEKAESDNPIQRDIERDLNAEPGTRNPEPPGPPADTSADALKELENAIRGNQLKPEQRVPRSMAEPPPEPPSPPEQGGGPPDQPPPEPPPPPAPVSTDAPKSSTQLTLDPEAAKPFVDFARSIPDEEVFHKLDETGKDDYGIETEPHITALFGLTEHEPAPVAKAVADHGQIEVTLGKLSVFKNPEYDVLKVGVSGDSLHALNGKLSKLPNEQSFSDYQPHLTIAYLKKGQGAKYEGSTRFQGQKLTFDTVTFSPPKEVRARIGKPELPLLDKQGPTDLQKPPVVAQETQPAAAETITGPGPSLKPRLTGNEEKASEIPAEAAPSAPPPQAPSKPSRPRPSRAAGERPWDIIDEIEGEIGHIDPSLIREGNPHWRPAGAARRIFRSGGQAADTAINGLTYNGPKLGLHPDMKPAEFGDQINAAANARKDWRSKNKAQNDLIEQQSRDYEQRRQFQNQALEGQRPKSAKKDVQQVPMEGLVVGDTFKVHDIRFKVTEMEFDPDDDGRLTSVTLEDGPKFGVQTIDNGAEVIHIDEGTLRRNRKGRSAAAEVPGSELEGPSSENPEPGTRNPEQTDPVERALDKLKADIKPGDLHLFGLVPELWNGLVETVRLAYRGGKTIAQAIEHGIEWLRATHKDATFEEGEIHKHFRQVLDAERMHPDRLGAVADRARAIRDEVRAMRARGEEPPRALLDEQSEHESIIEEALAGAKQPRGGIPINVEANPNAGRPARTGGTVPPFRGPEKLPAGKLRDMFEGLREWRARAGARWASRRERADITAGRDAGETRANLVGNESANAIRIRLNRAFRALPKDVRERNDLREWALTFAVEADRDRGALSDFHDMIVASPAAETTAGRRALRAIQFANEHWDTLGPVVEDYRRLTEAQRETELNEAVDSEEWTGGYVFHRWKQDGADLAADASRPSPAGTPFTKRRSFPTYAEGIAGGFTPHSLNGVDLLGARVASGQRVLNEARWVHGLRAMTDPKLDLPIATDVIWKARRPKGVPRDTTGAEPTPEEIAASAPARMEATAPPGYTVVELGDLRIALLRDYKGLFTDLTAASWARGGGIRAGLLKGAALSKHITLLFDTFHLGRLAFWKTVITGKPTYGRGVTLLDYTQADIAEMVQRGELPAAYGKELSANKAKLDLGLQQGFNIGSVADNLHAEWIQKLPLLGDFNKWLFGQYQRGAMAESFLIEFERTRRMLPTFTDAQVARRVAVDLNTRFGNLGRQGVFRSKTGQDLARLIFLAPQWNESLIRSEISSVVQLGRAPIESFQQRRLVAGTLLRATGTFLIGQFIANQLINYATRGKPTWDNEEEGFGPKISAWVPDVIGNGPGFFLNPMSIAAEITHLVLQKLERAGGTAGAADQILKGRLSAPARAVAIFATHKDALGRSLREPEVWPAIGKALIPVPIAGGAIAAAAKQVVTGQPSEQFPGQFQKQVMGSFGVKTDQAPSPEQRMRTLAREFNREKGIIPAAEFNAGDFAEYTEALRRGNMNDARRALEELVQKKTPQQIATHYERWVSAPYTGQTAREGEFLRGLTAEQRTQYLASREARKQIAIKARALAREVVTAVRP